MKLFLKLLSSFLLVFNGVGALYGGLHLISDPSGKSLELSVNWLRYSPFKDYLIPGIILFISNGLFSLIVLWQQWFNKKRSSLYVIAQGLILLGWIFIQILLIRTVYFLHIIMGAAGLALALLGWLQYRLNSGFSSPNN